MHVLFFKNRQACFMAGNEGLDSAQTTHGMLTKENIFGINAWPRLLRHLH
jgi:hypothetical protein